MRKRGSIMTTVQIDLSENDAYRLVVAVFNDQSRLPRTDELRAISVALSGLGIGSGNASLHWSRLLAARDRLADTLPF
jgi:hypothetical protein